MNGKMTIEEEAQKATELLKGKIVEKIQRYNESEIIIAFEDGTEIFIFCYNDEMNLSIADKFEENN